MKQKNDNIDLAKKLMSEAKYQEASVILEQLGKQDTESKPNYYPGFLLLNCYQKMALWQPALRLAEELVKYDDCWQSIKTSYAWIIYFAFFKAQSKIKIEELLLQIDLICDLLKMETSKLALFLAIQNMLSNHPQLDKILAVHLLEKIDFNSLKTEIQNKSDQHSNQSDIAERYSMLYSKYLLVAEYYDKCAEFCHQVLQESNSISPANRIWLSRRLALSLQKTGRSDQALEIYELLICQKPEWYIYFEYALILHKLENSGDALKNAAKAAIMKGDLEMKINLWNYLFSTLLSEGYYPQATKCLALAAAIRIQKSWPIDQKMLKDLALYNLDLKKLPAPKSIFSEIIEFLSKLSYDADSEKTGYLSHILPHGKAGFIKSGADSFYFKISDLSFSTQLLKTGMRLRFNLVKSFDPKKQMESQNAVNIRKDE
ncbi:MAG: hypothetical protein PHC50_07595 [Candidatus Cloacimonetes bacterium]|nr:hypothetical protein [Candidatus Cloacimonadota bacterium]